MNKPDKSEDYVALSYLEYRTDPMDTFYTHPILGLISRMRLKSIQKKLSGFENKTILDAGCEAGYMSIKLSESGFNVIPFDICKNAIHDLKNKLNSTNHEKITDPIAADIICLPFKTKTVDAIVCSEAIQFLKSPQKFMGEFERILKKDGLLVISFGNHRNRKLFFPILHFIGFNTEAIDKTFPYQHSLEDLVSSGTDKLTVEQIDYVPTRLITFTTIIVFRKK